MNAYEKEFQIFSYNITQAARIFYNYIEFNNQHFNDIKKLKKSMKIVRLMAIMNGIDQKLMMHYKIMLHFGAIITMSV